MNLLCPIHPQLKEVFHEFVRKHSQTVVKHGAKPVLFNHRNHPADN